MESKLSPRLVFALGQKRTDGGLHNSRWRRGSPLPPTGGFGEFKRSGSPHSGSSGDIWEEQPRQTEQPIRFLPPGLAWKSESYFRERKKKKKGKRKERKRKLMKNSIQITHLCYSSKWSQTGLFINSRSFTVHSRIFSRLLTPSYLLFSFDKWRVITTCTSLDCCND